MPGKASLSTVITSFNSGALVLDAIGSVMAQPIQADLEIIVVDDGSTDAESREAISYAERLPGVIVVRSPGNEGVQRARNRGLTAAHHNFILVLDSDDRLGMPDQSTGSQSYPDRAIAMLLEDEGLALVHTMSRMFGAFEGLTISSYPVKEALVLRKHHVPTSIVFRRSDCTNGVSYDPAILKWQDWSFAVGLLAGRWRRGGANRIGFVHGPFHRYRVHHDWDRISSHRVDEFAMTLRTVEANLNYFRAHLGQGRDASEIARQVLNEKPDRLADLLYMAAFDLQQALQVAAEREFDIASPYSHLGIP